MNVSVGFPKTVDSLEPQYTLLFMATGTAQAYFNYRRILNVNCPDATPLFNTTAGHGDNHAEVCFRQDILFAIQSRIARLPTRVRCRIDVRRATDHERRSQQTDHVKRVHKI